MEDDALITTWNRAIARLEANSQLSPAGLGVLGVTKPLGMLANTMLLAVPNAFAKNQIDTKAIRPAIEHALSEETGQDIKIAVTIDEQMDLDDIEPDQPAAPALHVVSDTPQPQAGSATPQVPTPAQASSPQVAPISAPLEGDRPTATSTAPSAEAPSEGAIPPLPKDNPFPVTPHQPTLGSAPLNPPTELPTKPQPAAHVAVDAETHLNPNYTFSTFVIGASNRFATAAATATAENPGGAYNPLFIFGGSGLGKTHLLHAIGHEALSLQPDLRVKYVSSEEFTNDFINSIASGRAQEFQNRYRAVDILLVDDIQFLQGKEQTIEEFFHTFNALHTQGSQIVITSDMPPKRLGGFEERMRSRFEWGLQVDIQPADLETRIAILSKKAEQERVQIALPVLEFIAERFSTNIRELEGALVRVTAFASLSHQPITRELAAVVLKDNVSDSPTTEITAALIQAQTAQYFNVSVDALCSSSRSRALTEARQIAMYLCRELTDLSLPAIGKSFGGRDHTTVIHANRKITENMSSKPQVYNDVTELTSRIRATARTM